MNDPRNFRVVHRLGRRVRILAPRLAKEAERCCLIEILLRKHPGIKDVRAVPQIGSVTIYYDPSRLTETQLLALADTIIGNIVSAPPAPPPAPTVLDGPVQECNVAVEGMTCASCAALIELTLRRDPRVASANVNFAARTATIVGQLAREDLFALVKKLGYEPYPMDTLAHRRLVVEREKARLAQAKRRAVQAAWLATPAMILGMLMHRSPALRVVEFALASAAIFGSGREIFAKARALARESHANMDTLIAFGAGSAYLYSVPGIVQMRRHVYFESAATTVAFVLLGRYLEERAKGKASAAIRKLIELQPAAAVRVTESGDETVLIEDVRADDLLRVRPGEKVPTDGVLVEGASSINEALLTGESLPVTKRPGDTIVGGCLNTTGAFTMRVSATGGDTVLAGIVKLVTDVQGAKLPVQKLADRISASFVPAVGIVAAATFGGWLSAGYSASRALTNAVAVLLIACPCALGLATPTAIMVGTGQAARRGIYIRNGEALETAAKLTTLVIDKTATITEGKPVVTDFEAVAGTDEAALLAMIAGVERDSEHFLGGAILAFCTDRGAKPVATTHFEARPGCGVLGRFGAHDILIGNATLMASAGITFDHLTARAETLAAQGKTPVFVALDGHCVGLIAIADRPRDGAKEAIALLHKLGLTTIMATGDVEAAANHVAREVGISRVVARATPADKLALIRELQQQGQKVGMVGDGVNDAPALAAADVGFAVGGGTDVAAESADVTLVGGDIIRVAAGIELSRRTMTTIAQNMFWALGYNSIAIPVAMSGYLTPMIASAAMALSSVSVVTNSLRLQRN